MKKMTLVLAIVLVAFVAAQAQASLTMWFGDAEGAPVSSVTVLPGETIDINVWMTTGVDSDAFAIGVGYDSATSMGTGATALEGKLAYVADSFAYGSGMGAYMIDAGVAFGGMRGSGTRPYGLVAGKNAFMDMVAPFTAPTLVASFQLTNQMAGVDSYDVVLWDAGTGSTWTTQLKAGAVYHRDSDVLTVNSIPEPVSLVLLGLGALGLLRRRS